MPNRIDAALTARLLPLALALLLAGTAPAAAQSEPTAFQKILGGLGLLELPGNDRPDYRERAPLVVPPSNALISPRSADDIAKYNPEWPVDHDNRPRKPVDTEAERKADDDFYSGRAVLPSELAPRKASKQDAGRKTGGSGTPDSLANSQRVLTPTELGFKGWGGGKKQDEKVVFTGEPERRSLTDPPQGLRTPSQDAPYGVVSNKPGAVKPANLSDRMTGQADPANRQ